MKLDYLDIVIVTYNSKKWMKNCLESILKSKNVDLKKVGVVIVDNNSTDDTIAQIKSLKLESKFRYLKIQVSNKNLGFGRANNLGSTLCESDFIFFLNPDTLLEENTLFECFREIREAKENEALLELRQRPYEHPKLYDILTGYTRWSSGACFIIRKDVFNLVGGFDRHIFMYAEDVDISYNIRMHGYKLKYIPKATITHFAYEYAGQVKKTQYYYGIINNLNLRLKYGYYTKFFKWHFSFIKILLKKSEFKWARFGLIKRYILNIPNMFYFAFWKHKKENKELIKNFTPDFLGYDYEVSRIGAFYRCDYIENRPLVSIIVRTCGRPNVLRETLISLKRQTYDNFEIIIVEDGKNISEDMINKEFSDLNIKYQATDKKVGRCIVGNIALKQAKGKYINFLDDDDLFYADHIETLVCALQKNPSYKIAYALSYESKIEVKSKEPQYVYQEYSKQVVNNAQYKRENLLLNNLFPIQTVMFEKSVYDKFGGFDETLDNLEDWDLWLRYAMDYDYLYVPKITSLYRVPYKIEDYELRKEKIEKYREVILNKIKTKYEFR